MSPIRTARRCSCGRDTRCLSGGALQLYVCSITRRSATAAWETRGRPLVVDCRPVVVRSPAHWPPASTGFAAASDGYSAAASDGVQDLVAHRGLAAQYGSADFIFPEIWSRPRRSRSARTIRSPAPSVSEPAEPKHRRVAGSGPETQNGCRADRKIPPNGAAGAISHQGQETSTPHRTTRNRIRRRPSPSNGRIT
jgi:hypothetical protein